MKKQVLSKVKNLSKLPPQEYRKSTRRPFEWWGPSPDAARQAMVSKPKDLHDKRMTLKEAVGKFVRDGINIGIGGFVNSRVPVAIVHEIIRHGARDLTLSFQSNSVCPELLAGAMILDPDRVSIRRVELAWWGYEVIGLAPLLRHLTSHGLMELDDYTNYGMAARFKAGAMGVPFLPTRDHGGSDMELVNRGTMIECPFSGKNVYLVPACHPDVGIVHVTAADAFGNCRIFGPQCTCPEIAAAAVDTIVTTEEIIPGDSIRNYPNLTEIAYPVVDAVVHQPYGALPGACYGRYWFDMVHLKKFREIGDEFRRTGNKEGLKKYYDEYIFGCADFDDFLEKITPRRLEELRALDGRQPVILD